MSTYTPAPWDLSGRRCTCGVQRTHHHPDGRCPEQYRPATLEEAQRTLARAEERGDLAAIFVARGEVQRLSGRKE